jgi:hypothetical protein
MVATMGGHAVLDSAMTADRSHLPSHVPSGAALLALELSEAARGIRGLDVLRRSVDRAPPVRA